MSNNIIVVDFNNQPEVLKTIEFNKKTAAACIVFDRFPIKINARQRTLYEISVVGATYINVIRVLEKKRLMGRDIGIYNICIMWYGRAKPDKEMEVDIRKVFVGGMHHEYIQSCPPRMLLNNDNKMCVAL